MVVPFAAGGTFDVLGRIIATRMAELLGQSIVVENVTGAGGIVGVTRVINAAPDGYTLLLGTVGTHAYNQWVYKKRRYDAIGDFTREIHFMGHDNHRSCLFRERTNHAQDFVYELRIQRTRRLVEQYQGGLHRERSRDRYALLLAPR